MSRKPKKGYYVQGLFIALGSELDLAYKRELKGTDAASKTDLKRESTERQKLGEDLLELRADLKEKLLLKGHLNTALIDAVSEAKRITNFEGKRRQMQYVGKLMRRLGQEDLEAIRDSLEIQHGGSAKETLALHESEAWRKRLIEDDQALGEWLAKYPRQEPQEFRALVRQARKDAQPLTRAEVSTGKAPRQGRAYRDLFRWIRETLHPSQDNPTQDHDAAAHLDLQDVDQQETEVTPPANEAQPIYLSVDEIKYKEELAKEELRAHQMEKVRLKDEDAAKKILAKTPRQPATKTASKTKRETALKEPSKTTGKTSASRTLKTAITPTQTQKASTKASTKAPTQSSAKTIAKAAMKKTEVTTTAKKSTTQTSPKTPLKTASKTLAKNTPAKSKPKTPSTQ